MTSEATVPEAALKQESTEFRAWVETLPDAHWAKHDLSACRLGWEAGRAALPHLSTAIHDVALEEAARAADAAELKWAVGSKNLADDPAMVGANTLAAASIGARDVAKDIRALKGKSIPAPAESNEAQSIAEVVRDAVIETAARPARRRGPYVFDEATLQAQARGAEGNEAEAEQPEAFIIERLIDGNRKVVLREQYDPREARFWSNETARAAHVVTPLFACPPVPAAPAQAPGELPWRDMSTAPKDGTHLLVKLPGETMPPTVAHWFQPVPGPDAGDAGWYLSVQQFAGPAIEPVGWLPIPALTRQEQRGAVEWRPIDTAPKDGTWVELWRPLPVEDGPSFEPLIVGRWYSFDDGEEAWVWPDDTFEVWTPHGRERANQMISVGDCYEDATGFTYWRPLTSPPAALAPVHQEAGE
jgi:hypothetical protein